MSKTNKTNILHMLIITMQMLVAFVSTASQAKQIDILDVKLVNGSCTEGYDAVTPDEARYLKMELVSQMRGKQISNLSDGWVIMGLFYDGRIKKISKPASTTWCKNLNPPSHDIPVYQPLILEEGNENTVEWGLINDKNFYQPLAELANLLGYAWPGGTGSEYVGEDMITWVTGEGKYRIDAQVGSPCSGSRCTDRLKMEISDFEYKIDPQTFDHGDISQTDRELVGQYVDVVTNDSGTMQQYRVSISYTKSSSWSKTDTHSFSQKLIVKKTFKWPLVGETDMSIELFGDESWSETTGGNDTQTFNGIAVIYVAAHTKQEVLLEVYRASISYPYSFNAEMSYDLKLTNFMQKENALLWHPTDFQNHTGHWVIGRNTDRHTDLGYQYSHRNIPTPDKVWDWPWVIRKYGEERSLMTMGRVLRKIYAPITGNFYAEASSASDLYFGKTIHIPDNELTSPKSLQIDKELKQNSLTNEELEQNGIYNFRFEVKPIAKLKVSS